MKRLVWTTPGSESSKTSPVAGTSPDPYLGTLTGTVLGKPRLQRDGLYEQDVLLDGGNVAIYKDLATVSVRPGQRVAYGTTIGTVGSGVETMGLHFALCVEEKKKEMLTEA